MTTPRAISLYRQLLRTHRIKLPRAMRDLGDSYIKSEFRLHRKAKPEHLDRFFAEWENYLQSLQGRRGQFGNDMNAADKQALTAEQQQKLDELQAETRAMREKDNHS